MTTEIKLTKSKLGFLFSIAGALALLWQGILLIDGTAMENYPNLKRNMGIVSIIFWTTIIIWALQNYIRKPYGLILNSEGIINNTNNLQEFIAWDQIEKYDLINSKGKQLLAIQAKEKSLIELEQNLPKKNTKQLRQNIKRHGYPIIIVPKKTNKTGEEILALIKNHQH